MIQGERVLLICKEDYSYPMFFVAENLKKDNEIAVFFTYHIESMYRSSVYNKMSYYEFKKVHPDIKLYDVKDIGETFLADKANNGLDYDYINHIEKDYTHFKGIWLQFISDQILSSEYHDRSYYYGGTETDYLYWLQLNYKNVEYIVDEFHPTVVLDVNDETIQRTILNEVLYKNRIPYITIGFSRYELYKYPTFVLGLEIDKYLIKEFDRNLNLSKKELEDEIDYLKKLCNRNIMSSEYAGTITARYSKENPYKIIKEIVINAVSSVRVMASTIPRYRKRNLINIRRIELYKFIVLSTLKRQYLLGKNKYFKLPGKDEKYFYMPLHFYPESSVVVKAPYYADEFSIICAVSKSLPVGYTLYVKEHQSMLGQRPLSFYEKVNKLKNVMMVQINYYTDPLPWIINSSGVITITGTTACEAAFLGKEAIVFGTIPFQLIEGVHRVYGYEELPQVIRKIINNPVNKDEQQHSCASYIRTMKRVGTELNLLRLLVSCKKKVCKLEIDEAEFEKDMNDLMNFYENGLKIYRENNELDT